MKQDYEDGIEIINTAIRKQEEEKAWDLYIAKYQHMDKKTYIPFEKFYNIDARDTNKNKSENMYVEEIRAEAEKIKRIHQNRKKVI